MSNLTFVTGPPGIVGTRIMLRFGRDRELHRVLDELHDQPKLGRRVAEDPRSFLEERGNLKA